MREDSIGVLFVSNQLKVDDTEVATLGSKSQKRRGLPPHPLPFPKSSIIIRWSMNRSLYSA